MREKGVYELCKKHDVRIMNFEDLSQKEWVRFQPEGSHWRDGFLVAGPVAGSPCVVTTCCLKTHGYGGVFTMSLKLSVGVTHKKNMRELHTSFLSMRKMIAEINTAYRPSLILLDGLVYRMGMPTTTILQNLYAAHEIGPTVVAFVDDPRGDLWRTDLYFSDDFVRFLADELVPWLQREFAFHARASRTTIGGASIAGMTAVFAALRRPGVFGNVLSQSGSFWINNHDADNGEPEWLARQFVRAPPSSVHFWLEVGQMEFVANEADRIFPPFIPGSTNLLASNRHLRDVLRARGYRIDYTEMYADHEPLHWQRALPNGLMALLSRNVVSPAASAGAP